MQLFKSHILQQTWLRTDSSWNLICFFFSETILSGWEVSSGRGELSFSENCKVALAILEIPVPIA